MKRLTSPKALRFYLESDFRPDLQFAVSSLYNVKRRNLFSTRTNGPGIELPITLFFNTTLQHKLPFPSPNYCNSFHFNIKDFRFLSYVVSTTANDGNGTRLAPDLFVQSVIDVFFNFQLFRKFGTLIIQPKFSILQWLSVHQGVESNFWWWWKGIFNFFGGIADLEATLFVSARGTQQLTNFLPSQSWKVRHFLSFLYLNLTKR